MSTLNEWINDTLYPAVFEQADTVFPEHNFQLIRGNWHSQTRLFGDPYPGRKDKTKINKGAPHWIFEEGDRGLSLVDYVSERDNKTFIESVMALADKVGLQVPPNPNFDLEGFKAFKERSSILETLNDYFKYILLNHADGKDVKDYLNNKRGYGDDEIEAMGLGCITSTERVQAYLKKKGYSDTIIEESVLKGLKNSEGELRASIGKTYKLTIPFRSAGYIRGFKFRAIDDAVKPKYINTTGLDKVGGFFNISPLKGDKDLVIVEGELDALYSTISGIENVVALAGHDINPEQIADAKKKGAKRVTICMDYEPGGKTQEANLKALDKLKGDIGIKVYIAEFPGTGSTKIDPDSFIGSEGVEAFRSVIKNAQASWFYILKTILSKYSGKNLTYKETDDFKEEIYLAGSEISNPVDRDLFLKTFTDHVQNITKEAIAAVVDNLRYKRDREEQNKALKRLLSEARGLQESGNLSDAISLLERSAKSLKGKDKKGLFNDLVTPVTESGIRLRQIDKPESIFSGFRINGEDLFIPSGALTLFAAPTSHGKTTILINTLINVAERHGDKQHYLLSFEEDGDTVLISALNTFINADLSRNNRRSIKSYYLNGGTDMYPGILEKFQTEKNRFFSEYINTGRINIKYVNYDSDSLIEAIRFLASNGNVGSIFIDYIQLLKKKGGKFFSRQDELSAICQDLKDVSVETGLPIIFGAQFNREVVNLLKIHETKLREAADIEQAANLIVGFWNNTKKSILSDNERKEIGDKLVNGRPVDLPNSIYAIVLKQRGGVAGGEELFDFNGNTGRVANHSTVQFQSIKQVIDPF